MRIWVYGDNLEQIQAMVESANRSGDTVVGTSACADACSAFPRSGLVPAISAAIRGELDLLLIPSFQLPGLESNEQMTELFQSYGVVIKSASN